VEPSGGAAASQTFGAWLAVRVPSISSDAHAPIANATHTKPHAP
jgi:hypothetical protein